MKYTILLLLLILAGCVQVDVKHETNVLTFVEGDVNVPVDISAEIGD